MASLRARNVAFDLQDTHASGSATAAPHSAPKSVLKQKKNATLPPPARYRHPDPLLRRLRMIDGHGQGVDLKQAFRDTKLVVFYFGSHWNATDGRGCQQLVSNLCRQYPHEVKVVYVSVDTDARHYKAATRNRPWLSLEWHDGSSIDPDKEEEEEDALPEQFLLADDADPDDSVVQSDATGTSYVRPFSRVHMAYKFDVLMTPTLVVYHVPTRRILDKNVRLQRLRSERLHQSVSVWLRGETSPPINWIDVVYMTPWTFISAALLLLYLGLRLVLGDQISLSHIWKQFT